MDLRIEAAVEAGGKPEHGERALGVPGEPEDEHLALGPRPLEVGGPERDARNCRPLVLGQDGEGIEAERRGELPGTQHRAAEQTRRLFEAGNLHSAR